MPLIALIFLFLFVGPVDQYDTVKAETHTSAPKQSSTDEALARYTLALAVFTGVLAVSTSLLSLFTYRLWSATRDVVLDGRDTAERQLRAYVFVSDTNYDSTGVTFPNVVAYMPTMKNSGQTPAYDVVFRTQIAFCPKDKLPPLEPLGDNVSYAPLAPGAVLKSPQPPMQIDLGRLALIQAGTHAVYLYGRIEYRDIFGTLRHTTFRYVRAKDSHYLMNTREGNEAN